jgi:spermidine synthase
MVTGEVERSAPGTKVIDTVIIFVLVFFGGFASLATEIIGPRLIASLFGSTTLIWAIIISITLIGLALGYFLGGRVSRRHARWVLPTVLIANALWLMAVSWLVWTIPNRYAGLGVQNILVTALAAFFVPSTLFGTISILAITLLSLSRSAEEMSKLVGGVYAVSTVGSVLGAVSAAFFFIPWVGLTASLRLFAIGLVLFSGYFLFRRTLVAPGAALAVCLFVALPSFQWSSTYRLVAQAEGYYETIRIYTDDESFIRLHLGDTYESEMDLKTREPNFRYAKTMLSLAGDVAGKHVLCIGGAGHAIARALENRGATVVEVEIDPVVVKMSDQYFGPLRGTVVVQDGRTYVNQSPPAQFDYVFVDAFNGAASVPPQLTTLEFFQAVRRVMKPTGQMLYNFIGAPSGKKSESFGALARTIADAFVDARMAAAGGQITQNIIFAASASPIPGTADGQLSPAPRDGFLLTDDLNPIDVLIERSR